MPSKILESAVELNKISFDSSNNKLNFLVPITSNGNPIADETAGLYANAAFEKANAAFVSANNVAPQVQPAFDKANAAFSVANSATSYGANTNATSFLSIPVGTTAQRPSNPLVGSSRYNTDINGLEVYTPNGWQPLAAPPSIISVTPDVFSGDAGSLFIINGANFTPDAQIYFLTSNNTSLLAGSITFISSVQVRATTPRNIKIEEEPLSVRIVQQSGTSTKIDCIDAGGTPNWITTAGNLGSIPGSNVVNVFVTATDPEGTAVTYQVSSGALPNGLVLSANGLIQGLANSVLSNTTYNFVIKANDTVNNNTDRTFSYTILNRAPVFNNSPGITSTIYSGNNVPSTLISAYDPDGGQLSYSSPFSNVPNTEFVIANTTIVGNPILVTSNTDYSIDVSATDEGSLTSTSRYTFRILNRPAVINTAAGLLGSVFSGNSINTTIDAYDPDGEPVTYSIVSGNLIASTNIGSSNGIISGIPITVTANTTYSFTVRATDIGGDSDTKSYTYRLLNRPPVFNTAAGVIGSVYSGNSVNATIEAYDPDGSSVSYSVVSGNLPPQITLNSGTGSLTASNITTVLTDTTYNFVVNASDGEAISSRNYAYTVLNRPPIINTAAGVVGTIVSGNVIPSTTISAYDPDGQVITFSAPTGNIVNAYIGSSNGIITGTSAVTVTTNTTYTMGVRVTDSGGAFTDRNYSFNILNRPPIINTASAILATVASGGSLPANTINAYDPDGGAISYSVTSGNASSWTSINSSTGVLSGTATTGTVGSNTTYTFAVTATDPGGMTTSRNYSWIVQMPLPTWTTASDLGVGYTAASYSFTVAATGATSYSLVSGSLPAGYSLNGSTGVISGTISTAISDYSYLDYSFTVRATNTVGVSDRTFTLRMWSRYRAKSCYVIGEGGTLNVTAPTDENGRLLVWNRKLFSAYGTPQGDCPNYTNGSCNSPSSNSWTPTLPSRTIVQAWSNSEWGDPCGGTFKEAKIILVYGT